MPTQVVAPYRPNLKDSEAAPLLSDGDCGPPLATPLQDHEYHEISDEEGIEEDAAEAAAQHSPLDLGKMFHH